MVSKIFSELFLSVLPLSFTTKACHNVIISTHFSLYKKKKKSQ